jgi:hypothetical protein
VTGRSRHVLGAGCALLVFALAASSAGATRKFDVGFADSVYAHPQPSTRAAWLDRTVDASASWVRVDVHWATIAGPNPPPDPANPASGSYNFAAVDNAVRDATARGLNVLFTVATAPTWAEGPNRPGLAAAPKGSWKPDPQAFGSFARALAARYSGGFDPPGSVPILPRVRHFQALNEPNLSTYLSPQWSGGQPVSTSHYARLLNAFYSQVKAVRADNLVVTAGTGPFGQKKGGQRMRPLKFWQSLLCLKKNKRGKLRPRRRCENPIHADVIAHHPITGRPGRRAEHKGDAVIPELRKIRRMARKAERRGWLLPGGRTPLWVTELWWESDPPDDFARVSVRKQARWIAEGLYLIYKQRVPVVILLQIRDAPYDPGDPFATIQSGIFFEGGASKPSFKAVRFPFVTERRGPRKLKAWGKSPVAGKLTIERKRRGKWHALKRRNVAAEGVFSTALRVRGTAKLRARVGGERSRTWHQRD